MREINESWSVLRNADSRRRYDTSLRAAASGGGTRRSGQAAAPTPDTGLRASPYAGTPRVGPQFDDESGEVGFVGNLLAHHLPWVLALLVLGVIFVFTSYATSRGDDLQPASPVPFEQSCVNVTPGPVTTIVDCVGPHELRIVGRVTETQPCPAETERRRLTSETLLECVLVE